MPKVSVLVPAYNHKKYISATIQSVLDQSFTDFELLISDDCSSDGTPKAIKSFNDSRINTFFFKKNVGTVRSLNHLLDKACGEYIAVLGSDDIWEKDKLEIQVGILEKNKQIAACFTDATIIDSNFNTINDPCVFPVKIFDLKSHTRADILREFYLSGNHFCHSSVLIRKSAHNKIGQYNTIYRQLHDFDLWVRLLLEYEVYFSELPLVKYRFVKSNNNVSKFSNANNIRLFNEGEEIIYKLFKNITDKDFYAAFKNYMIFKSENLSSEQIICEKFFILKNQLFWGTKNTSLAIRYLLENSTEAVLQTLENNYGFSLSEVYAFTGKIRDTVYNLTADNESFEGLKKQRDELLAVIDSIHCSNSWKLTAPLRKLSDIFSK